jgi:RNA polymerase sigma-70 factor (sigma-E family)
MSGWSSEGVNVDFDEFTETGLRPLLHFTRVLTGDRALAEDVVQEVLVRLHARGDRLGDIEHLGAYARRMAVNEYLGWRRKWSRQQPMSVPPEPPPQPDHAERHAEHDWLSSELARLPRRQRAVLVLRYYAGLTDAEIADELGCSPGTVRSHASRALATLRVEITHLQELPT